MTLVELGEVIVVHALVGDRRWFFRRVAQERQLGRGSEGEPAGSVPMDADREIGRLVLEKLEPLPTADLARFGPPARARVEEECNDLKWPVVVPSSKAKPVYPRHLAQKRISGYVVFEASIDVDGSVTELHALRASHPDFVGPARDAILRWKYRPAKCNGKPLKTQMQVVLDFDA